MPDGDRFVIVASKEGRPTNPDWYYNLVANLMVSVEVGTEQFEAPATVVDETEYSDLFAKVSSHLPRLAEYQEKTTRVIPVIILSRR